MRLSERTGVGTALAGFWRDSFAEPQPVNMVAAREARDLILEHGGRLDIELSDGRTLHAVCEPNGSSGYDCRLGLSPDGAP